MTRHSPVWFLRSSDILIEATWPKSRSCDSQAMDCLIKRCQPTSLKMKSCSILAAGDSTRFFTVIRL